MPPSKSSFTYTLKPDQIIQLRELCLGRGFELKALDYGHFKGSKGKCSLSAYESGKVVIQGKEAREFIEFYFEPEILGEAQLGYEEIHHPEYFVDHFGVDEAGKGDFFGPLVIAGVAGTGDLVRGWIDAGLAESKRIADQRALDQAGDLEEELGAARYEVIAIGPKRYNELYRSFGNLNRLLAWGHAKVIQNLKIKNPAVNKALSDKFAHSSLIERELKKAEVEIDLDQQTKAERDPVVAAASILARAGFLKGLEKCSELCGVELPKGAGAPIPKAAAQVLDAGGQDLLRDVCKVHFKTFAEVTR
ncbi:MAG: ribonuclease HIII [Verrucomicrobiota bacterium]